MSEQRDRALRYLRQNPEATGAQLAQALDIPGRSARRYRRSFRHNRADTYVFTGNESTTIMLPEFTGFPRITGDWVICGDVHLPTTNFEFAHALLDTAKYLNIRNLAIVGDLLNMDAFSKYDHIVPPPEFAAEVEPAVRLLAEYSAWFDQMIMTLGNHEHRLFKAVRGNFRSDWFARILNATDGKLHITPYGHLELQSGDEKWRLTHPGNYSKNKAKVANLLAQKYQCNIVSFHEHHVAKTLDDYGRYTIINGGGLFDFKKMAYVMLVDTTSTVMNNGFVVIQDGTGDLVTPYPAFTDFERYNL